MQVRREEILNATISAIREHGIESLRISDIATRLDVSSALVIYHFQTKENLLIETFRHAAEGDLLKLRRIARSPGPIRVRIEKCLQWYGPSGQSRGWMVWIDGWAAALRDPALAAVIGELDQQWTQELVELIQQGIAAGELSPPDAEEPAELAARITAVLDGLAVKTLVYGAGPRKALIDSSIDRLLATELGLSPAATTPRY